MNTIITVIGIILVIVVILLGILYFIGSRLEKKQSEQQAAIEALNKVVSMLVIDKKRLKIKESGLPRIVYEQTPAYLRWTKVPVVKAKIGSKIMTLMADEKVFGLLPLKSEVKVVISGIYISEIKSVRGGIPVKNETKKGFFAKFAEKMQTRVQEQKQKTK